MIPRLAHGAPVEDVYLAYLDALRSAGFSGDVEVDHARRVVAATDNSVYQILPQAVILPRTTEDVVTALRLAHEERFRQVKLAPRGGGTGTNGQSLTDGLILDLSRHLTRILELELELELDSEPDVDLAGGWVRVEPGVVLDQLNDHLRPHGVFFAPTVSPSSRATLGGMIATDASGKGSRIYGKTSDHVLELTVVLADGTVHVSGPLDAAALEAMKARSDLLGQVARTVDDVVTRQRDLIARRFPRLQRSLTGYDLARVRDEARGLFDLNAVLTGSEGTLGVVVEARLRLTPIPPHRRVVLIELGSFDDALGSARQLLAAQPSAIETIDETVLELARGDAIFHEVEHLIGDGAAGPDPGDRPTRAINLVEFVSVDEHEVSAKVAALVADLEAHRGEPGQPLAHHVCRDQAEADALWRLRKKGVGLLGNAAGARKPIAFMEDTVVPPERLGDYVRDLRAILDEAGLTYGMFGHVDVGCLHVRPALDMKDPRDEALLRRLSDRVVELVASYGGLMWGEHGKGFRSEYNPAFFGDELYRELCRVKGAFDPRGQLNPGKLAVPLGSEAALVSVDALKRGAFDRQIPPAVRAEYEAALTCNGNGACFDYQPDHVMCPSARVTRDRLHSPKGRAGVLVRCGGFSRRTAIGKKTRCEMCEVDSTGVVAAAGPGRPRCGCSAVHTLKEKTHEQGP